MMKYSTLVAISALLLIFGAMPALSVTEFQEKPKSVKAFPVTGDLERLSVIDNKIFSESVNVSGPGFTLDTVDAGLQKAWLLVHVSLDFERDPAVLYFDQIRLRSPSRKKIPLSFFRSDSKFPFDRAGEGGGSFNKVGVAGEAGKIWSYVVDRGAIDGRDRYGLVFFEANIDIELVFLVDSQTDKHLLSIADSTVELLQ